MNVEQPKQAAGRCQRYTWDWMKRINRHPAYSTAKKRPREGNINRCSTYGLIHTSAHVKRMTCNLPTPMALEEFINRNVRPREDKQDCLLPVDLAAAKIEI